MATYGTWSRCTMHAMLTTLTAAGTASASDWLDTDAAILSEDGKTAWYNVFELTLEGKGWENTAEPFDRLPPQAEGVVRPPVWDLSRHSAGICVRFVTDATSIQAHWLLRSKSLAMNHMPATGVSGVDLYVKTEEGQWRWLAVGRPTDQDNRTALIGGLPQGEREYMLYLPLYNGVQEVEIGIPAKARMAAAPERPPKRQAPLLFYGTSITQGGCASRPGMVHTAIIGRDLNVPVLNLGFSGNGKMEAEIAALLAELTPAVYVLDCLPNMNAKEVSERLVPFVKTLRESRPTIPILLVEDRTYSNSFLHHGNSERNLSSRRALQEAYNQLIEEGVKGLHYLEGEDLLGSDGEGTVDGSHPTDLGFYRQAQVMKQAIAPLLTPLTP